MSPSYPAQLELGRVAIVESRDPATTVPLSAANRSSFLAGKMLRGSDVLQSRSQHSADATSSRHSRSTGQIAGRDSPMGPGRDPAKEHGHPSPRNGGSPRHSLLFKQPPQILSSTSNSQDTSSTNDTTDQIFTPPASEGGLSHTNGHGNGLDSSQESQLLQLSQIAAAQDKMPDTSDPIGDGRDGNSSQSRKRKADGLVKNAAERLSASPVLAGGHSRNTSTVSVVSTAGSRIGELSAELRARLSYAMVKVNHGWQSHSIDQVETLASQSASPTSSNSTIHLRQGASASPQLSTSSHHGSSNSTPATAVLHQFQARAADPSYTMWRDSARSLAQSNTASASATSKSTSSLAPPVTIQHSQHLANPRRTANPRHTPAFAAHSHNASPTTAPHTPGQPSPYLGSPHQGTPVVDPILFSPHQTPQQNVREQDAMEALLFMSSPGNSANLKHNFPSSSQPLASSRHGLQRTALPNSQPRKSLPTGRPFTQSQPKRVGFERSPGNPNQMDLDDPTASPYSRGTPKRKVLAIDGRATDRQQAPSSRLKQLPLSTGLSAPPRPRRVLADEDIDRMLDRVAAEESSDSEGEIQIPVRPQRREGAPAAVH